MSGRDAVLGRVRAALSRGADADDTVAADRVRAHPRHTVPARGQLDAAARRRLFVDMATEAAATVDVVGAPDEVPQAVADYLVGRNMPPRLRMAPDPSLEGLPWDRVPMLDISQGATDGTDDVGLTGAFGAVAETGTLLLASGPDHPTTLNFLPETHVVVLRASQIAGPYEDIWDKVRAAFGRDLPRTLNFVTGPSRSADIEQTLQMGAHGPRRLHIVLIDDTEAG